MIQGTYILESEWCWDTTNREFASITVETPDRAFELLKAEELSKLVPVFKKIADAQNGSTCGEAKLVALHRIHRGDFYATRNTAGHLQKVSMTLDLICTFDEHGRACKAQQEERLRSHIGAMPPGCEV